MEKTGKMETNGSFLLRCAQCGEAFFTAGEKAFYIQKGLTLPKRCKRCRDEQKRLKAAVGEPIEHSGQIETEATTLAKICATLPFAQRSAAEIRAVHPEQTLYLIGNGFDRMHGARCSYYDFRDSLGRSSELRDALEVYIKRADIWGDFEDSLAYLDREAMMDSVDQWLDGFDVHDEEDENFSYANYFLVIEATAMPAQIIPMELPKRFRRWIKTLTPQSTTRPLSGLLCTEARYLNFNYTEFLETLYGIKKGKINYLHGDRRNKAEPLIIGHGHGISEVFDQWFEANKNRKEFSPFRYGRKGCRYRNDNPTYLAYFLTDDSKGNWHSQTRYDAIQAAIYNIEEYYEASAKKTAEVLEKNREYFQSLADLTQIIVIGHSLSAVDDPYFEQIIKNNQNPEKIDWQISWHCAADLLRIKNFAGKMGIADSQITVFQT